MFLVTTILKVSINSVCKMTDQADPKNKKLQQWIADQSLDFLYGNAMPSVFGSLVAVLLLAVVIATEVSQLPLVIWTTAGLLIGCYRIYLWYGYTHFRARNSSDGWLLRYRAMSLLSGLLNGLSMWLFFDQLTFAYQLLIPLLIVGLTAASLGTHAVDKITFQLFTYSACGLATLKFLISAEAAYQALAFMYVIYMVVMVRAGNQTFSTLRQNFELTHSMQFRATHDPLVGLLNREEFENQFETLTTRSRQGVAILFIDLDNFKPLNDTLGIRPEMRL